jgi:putative transposase
MKKPTPSSQRHRFPSEIISRAVCLYHRFWFSFREIEELLAERGITGTYETVPKWFQKFDPDYARKLKKRQGRLIATWHLDEVFDSIQGQQSYLWRAVDQDGDVIDILVQRQRNRGCGRTLFPPYHQRLRR